MAKKKKEKLMDENEYKELIKPESKKTSAKTAKVIALKNTKIGGVFYEKGKEYKLEKSLANMLAQAQSFNLI